MYEDFKDIIEDVQLVIPSTFEECFTYELQILYLKHLIDNIEPGGDYQEEINNINKALSALQSEVAKLNGDIKNLNPEEVQKKLDAMKTEINAVKESVATLTADVSAVKQGLAGKQNKLTFDSTPTAGSNNPVTSDGIKKALDNVDVGNVQEQLDAIKSEQTEQNKNISDNKSEIDSVKESVANQETDITALQETTAGHTTAIEGLQTGKQNVLTFDSTPTAGSNNPVTSDGIKKAIDAGGGGGGTGDSDFIVKMFDSSLSLTLTNKTTVTYELSSSGIARRTDVELQSITIYGDDIKKFYVRLPKAENSYLHDVLFGSVALKNIGNGFAAIPVKNKKNGVSITSDTGPIFLDINNHLYIVFPRYNLTTIS